MDGDTKLFSVFVRPNLAVSPCMVDSVDTDDRDVSITIKLTFHISFCDNFPSVSRREGSNGRNTGFIFTGRNSSPACVQERGFFRDLFLPAGFT